MNVIILQVFVGLSLAAAALILFAYSVRSGDHEHAERLSLLPIAHDDKNAPPGADAQSVRPSSTAQRATTG